MVWANESQGCRRALGELLSDKLVVEKARTLAAKLELSDFIVSDSWLAKFKSRHVHNIKLHRSRPHGKSGAADLEGADVA